MDIKVIGSGSSGNCYRVSDGKTALLLDAGLPIGRIREAVGFRLSDISAALISHHHGDHFKAVPDLVKGGMDVYMSRECAGEKAFSSHRLRIVEPMKKVTVGTFEVIPFDVQHDAPGTLGYLLTSLETRERLLYFTDTFYVKYRFPGITHIMGECNYSSEIIYDSIERGYIPVELAPRLMRSHMSLEHFIEMLKANDMSKVRQIYLLHLSGNNADRSRFRSEVEKVTGAEVYVC